MAAVVVTLTVVSACGSSSTAPTSSGNTLQLTGTVRTGGLALVGANVKILDGANQNKSAITDAGGRYALTALSAGGFTLEVTATGYTTVNKAVTLTASAAAEVPTMSRCSRTRTLRTSFLRPTQMPFGVTASPS